jgi:integral membrane protein
VLQTSIGRLRAAGLAEGVSFLLLLGIAMPLKHIAGIPIAVKIAGWIHGVLFIIFCVMLHRAKTEHRWRTRKAATFLIAALLPFGPFVIDRGLKEEDRA